MSNEEKLTLVGGLSDALKFNYRRVLLEKARMGRSVVVADESGAHRAIKAKKVLSDLLSHRPLKFE